MYVLKFYRGIIIVKPYGTYIRNKIKKLIIKSKKIESIVNKNLLLIENKIALGLIKLGIPKKINLAEFDKLKNYHKITKDDRIKWWPNYVDLYSYPIIKTKFFKIPLMINYPTGPQITICPKNIWVKKILIGMSGYHYKYMYPKNTSNLLDYYFNNSKLNSVEINYTFYKQPNKNFIDNLNNYNLIYTIKVNRYITHIKKLKNVKDSWEIFYNSLQTIHNKIFCFLFQFNAQFLFNEKNLDKLQKLSLYLNKNHKYAFEFRNIGWFNNNSVINLFKENQWISVIVNLNNSNKWADNLENGYNPPLKYYKLTSDTVYFRMHGTTGQYIGLYSKKELYDIIKFIERANIKYAMIYFNNTDLDAEAWINANFVAKKINDLNKE